MEIKGGDASTIRPQKRDLDQAGWHGGVFIATDRMSQVRGPGLGKETDQELSEREETHQGACEGLGRAKRLKQEGGSLMSITQGTQH